MTEIEKFTKEKITELTALVIDLWPGCNYDEEYKNCVRILDSEKEEIFLATADGKSIGFIYLNLRSDYVEGTDSSPVGYIEGLYVVPAYRKQGVAKKLVETGEIWSREKGCTQYASDTELENKASIAFHKSIGFKETGRVVYFLKELK